MAYIQFLSEQLITEEQIFLDVMASAYRIDNLEAVTCYYKKEYSFWKIYKSDEGVKEEERINFLKPNIDTYNEYLKYNELDRFVYSNLIEGKKLIPLFSADKVRCKRLLFEFTLEYLKVHPDNYLLIDEVDFYDLKRVENLNLDSPHKFFN